MFKDLRAKELKHGRAAMMGSVGMLTQSLVQVPGMEGVPKSAQAIFVGNGMVGGIAVLALIGVLEAFVFVQDESKEPGNFGNPLPLVGDDYSDEMRAKELNNGRIAMFAATSSALGSQRRPLGRKEKKIRAARIRTARFWVAPRCFHTRRGMHDFLLKDLEVPTDFHDE